MISFSPFNGCKFIVTCHNGATVYGTTYVSTIEETETIVSQYQKHGAKAGWRTLTAEEAEACKQLEY